MNKGKHKSPLTGEALLKKVKELENLSKEEKARACGYYTVTKNGVERVNYLQFLNALMDAQGIELDGKQDTNGRGGRTASYKISVQSNGNLLIGSAYTKQMGVKTGDEFEIILGRKHIHLRQVVIGDTEEKEEDMAVAS
ncbi:MAG: AbrB family transcriptional regulator [Chamaesiphon sp.]